MFQMLLGIIIGAIATIAILASRKPDDFKYSRSIIINAPASAVFPEMNSPRKVNTWSPWLDLDRNAKISYNDISEGVGASYHWAGNKNIGQGSATITESKPNELVVTRLDFIKPMKATNTAYFKLEEADGKTTVTWSMEGKNKFISKVFIVFIDCEKMVSQQFDKGLNSLKRLVEAK